MGDIKKEAFDLSELKKAEGYKPYWASLNREIGLLSVLNQKQKSKLPEVDGDKNGVLKYSHLSVLYNKARRMPFVSAYNIDSTNTKTVRTKFKADERISKEIQLEEEAFYGLVPESDKDFEIGHMAAHDEMAWGKDAQLQSYRTFFFPNSCPQVKRLNAGLWRGLEQYFIKEAADIKNKKAHIFSGPVLKENDPLYVNDKSFRLPLYFFKVVVFEHNGVLKSTAFIMSQRKRLKELKLIEGEMELIKELVEEDETIPFMDYSHKDVFQVNVDAVEKLTGLTFDWTGVKRVLIPNGSNKLVAISKITGGDELKKVEGMEEMALPVENLNESEKFKVQNFIYN